MEYDLQLLSLLIWHPVDEIVSVAHAELAPRECHPRVPLLVAGSLKRMVRVLLRLVDVDASAGKCLAGGYAHVRLLRVPQPLLLRNDTHQRTVGAAVRLLSWELYLYDVVFRHYF